jgi:hypothetical protein
MADENVVPPQLARQETGTLEDFDFEPFPFLNGMEDDAFRNNIWFPDDEPFEQEDVPDDKTEDEDSSDEEVDDEELINEIVNNA